MNLHRHHFFSLHELLIMAALAALGGVSGAAISMIRAAVHAVVVLPGGMQFLGGIHVLWPVLAVGLIRKPGAATATALLQGTVEFLSGNPHGLLVVAYAVFAGAGVDLVWLFLGGRDRPITYMLAGGVGAASNVLVLKLIASLPAHSGVSTGLALLATVAFISGTLLAGLLGWWLLQTLRLAGVVGAQAHGPPIAQARRRAGLGALAAVIALTGGVIYLASARADVATADDTRVSQATPGDITKTR